MGTLEGGLAAAVNAFWTSWKAAVHWTLMDTLEGGMADSAPSLRCTLSLMVQVLGTWTLLGTLDSGRWLGCRDGRAERRFECGFGRFWNAGPRKAAGVRRWTLLDTLH